MLAFKKNKRSITFWLAFLLLIAIISWLFYSNNGHRFFEQNSALSKENDTYLLINGVNLRRFDKAGNLTMIVIAEQAYQAAQDLPLELRSVTVTTHGIENEQTVQLAKIDSRFAIYNPLMGTLYACMDRLECISKNNTLLKNLWLWSKSEASDENVTLRDFTTSPLTLVKSPLLIYDVNTRMVSNDEPTSIQQGLNLLTGNGLKANLITHHYQLTQDVKASFIEQTSTTSQSK